MASDSLGATPDDLQEPLGECYVVLRNHTKLPVKPMRLARASCVISKIFYPHLPELFDGKEQNVIAFRDDEPEAVAFLLSVLQGRITSTSVTCIHLVQGVALLAKRYDCTEAMERLSKTWLAELTTSVEDPVDNSATFMAKMCDLVNISYFLDCPEEFFSITKKLILCSDEDLHHHGCPTYCAPVDVFLTVAAKKRQIHSELSYKLNKALNKWMLLLASRWTGCIHRGLNDATNPSCYLAYSAIHSQDFYPQDRDDYLLDDILDTLKSKELIEVELKEHLECFLCTKCYDRAVVGLGELSETMHEIGRKVQEMADGVCLDCVKQKAPSSHCRVKHMECPANQEDLMKDKSTPKDDEK